MQSFMQVRSPDFPAQAALPPESVASSEARALDQVLQEGLLLAVYQPIVSLAEKRIHAWEALSRGPLESPLHHPLHLFRVAREARQLGALESLSREKAIGGFARQQLPGKLFINVSPDLLSQPDHEPGQTLALLQQSGLQPHQVVIELTEQQPTHDFELLRRAISYYHQMGFKIALDDLGNGYSGLRLWSELRPDYVKIDRHFVQNIQSDRVKQDFVRFIHNIAKSLGTEVIVEGVETQAELLVLQDLGINLVQGYYFARPQANPVVELALENLHRPLNQPRVDEQEQVASLLCSVRSILPDTRVEDAVTLFREDDDLASLPVVNTAQQPLGLLVRDQMMRELLRPFGRELNYRRPVEQLMHRHPLTIEADRSLEEISHLVTERCREHREDDFIITHNGRYVGVGRVVDLLRIMTDLKVRHARQANPLTKLPGNGPIQDTLDHWLKSDRVPVICYLDLDNFKAFNDTYGFSQGDELLKGVALQLQKHLHPHDDFIGHVGGDDFIVLCRSADWEQRIVRLLQEFSEQVRGYYSPEDLEAGGIYAEDRFGTRRFFPFVAISVAALKPQPGVQLTAHALSADVAHLKHFAKQIQGCSLVLGKGTEQELLWSATGQAALT